MNATYLHDGEILDYTPPVEVPLGAVVVIGTLIGIAHRPIPAGTLGSLAITGVWAVPIASPSDAGLGVAVYWDPATAAATLNAAAPGVVRAGVLAKPLGATDTTLRVLINR